MSEEKKMETCCLVKKNGKESLAIVQGFEIDFKKGLPFVLWDLSKGHKRTKY